jgi:hypothetical protein
VERPRLTPIANPPPAASDFVPTQPPTGFLPTSPDLLLPSTPDLPLPAATSAASPAARASSGGARVRADAVGVVLPPAANPATGRDDSHRLSGFGELAPAAGAQPASKSGQRPLREGKEGRRGSDDTASQTDADAGAETPRPPWLSAAVAAAVLGLLLLLGWWAVGHG